jgi:SAM-dependent methyltransferase
MSSQQELFEQRYKQIASTNRTGWSDEVSIIESIERVRNLIRTQGLKPGKLLELGCGRGNLALAFEDDWQVTGVDFSPTAIAWAEDLASQQTKTAKFVQGDLREPWTYPDATFELVIDANCLHFFHGMDRIHFLKEAHRVLRPSGILAIATIVNEPDEEDWDMLGYDPAPRATFKDGVRMNYYSSEQELIDLVSSSGFQIVFSEITKIDGEHIWLVARKD